jgi:hypothetical protein
MLAPRAPTFVFSNPFHHQSVTVFNYSQRLPAPPADSVNDAKSLTTADLTIEVNDQARAVC